MESKYSKTFQMRFDLKNEQDLKISRFLQEYPWSRTQKVKEILLAYIEQSEETKHHPDVTLKAPEK